MNDAVVLVGLLATVSSIVATAVWVVSTFRRDTALLRLSIEHLTESVRMLRKSLEHVDQRTDNHEHRIIRLEAQASGPGNRASGS